MKSILHVLSLGKLKFAIYSESPWIYHPGHKILQLKLPILIWMTGSRLVPHWLLLFRSMHFNNIFRTTPFNV